MAKSSLNGHHKQIITETTIKKQQTQSPHLNVMISEHNIRTRIPAPRLPISLHLSFIPRHPIPSYHSIIQELIAKGLRNSSGILLRTLIPANLYLVLRTPRRISTWILSKTNGVYKYNWSSIIAISGSRETITMATSTKLNLLVETHHGISMFAFAFKLVFVRISR